MLQKENNMDVNTVIVAGRVTRDPELRTTPNGTSVCEVGLAINRKYKTSSGEQKRETTYVDVIFWNGKAGVVSTYVKKGTPLYIEGRLELDQWESQDGQKRNRLRIVADDFQFVERKNSNESAEADETSTADQLVEATA